MPARDGSPVDGPVDNAGSAGQAGETPGVAAGEERRGRAGAAGPRRDGRRWRGLRLRPREDCSHQRGDFLGGGGAPDDPEQRFFGRHGQRIRRCFSRLDGRWRAGGVATNPIGYRSRQCRTRCPNSLLTDIGYFRRSVRAAWAGSGKPATRCLHRDVAIKELVPPPGLTDDERREMRERSLREARAIARLNHVNVVRVFDVLRTDADPWIVMEYVPSRSLQDVLASDGPVSVTRAAEIGLGVLGALSAAHKAGVMHRDVKPGNVLLGDDGRVVLTDFGLATVPGDPNVTRTGLVLGSPAYIAPERARDGSAGPEADLWSLGATIYAAVEGQSPYARPSAIGTLTALATEPPPPLKNGGPLKPVISGLLQKNPAERMKADAAERLLRKAVGRKARSGISLLDLRRPGGDSSRTPRVAAVPAPRAAQDQPRPAEPAVEGTAATAKVDAAAPTNTPGAPSATSNPGTRSTTSDTGTPGTSAAAGAAAAVQRPGAADPAKFGQDATADPAKAASRGATVPPAGATRRIEATGIPDQRRAADATRRRPRRRRAAGTRPYGEEPQAGRDRSGRRPGAAARDRPADLPGPWQRRRCAACRTRTARHVSAPPPSEPAPTSAAPSESAAPSPTPSSDDDDDVLPQGWKLHEDPTGFKIPVPPGWKQESWNDGNVVFRAPNGKGLLLIGQTNQPKGDPVADWKAQEPYRRNFVQEYKLHGKIRAVEYRDWPTADWEWLETQNGTRMHVRNRAFVTDEDDQAYAIRWEVPADRWDAELKNFQIIANGFEPA